VCSSKKPRFFTEPEIAIEPAEEGLAAPNGALEPGRLYKGGCLAELERYLGESGDEIFYVGDHIYGDVLRAKKESAWRTMMIVQEMGPELEAHDRVEGELARLDELFDVGEILHDELRMHQAQLLQVEDGIAASSERASSILLGARVTHRRAIDRVKAKLAALDTERDALEDVTERAYHRWWGSLFKAGNEVSSLGDQIEQYACLYTDRVSNLLHYPPNHYFRGPRDRMPHEL
jgi:5'-nucleotidase